MNIRRIFALLSLLSLSAAATGCGNNPPENSDAQVSPDAPTVSDSAAPCMPEACDYGCLRQGALAGVCVFSTVCECRGLPAADAGDAGTDAASQGDASADSGSDASTETGAEGPETDAGAPDVIPEDSSAADAFTGPETGGPDASPDAPACPAGTDLTTTDNCGTCGNVCLDGVPCRTYGQIVGCSTSPTPVHFTCRDSSGNMSYNVNLTGDVNNCGTCGHACPSSDVCNMGVCVAR